MSTKFGRSDDIPNYTYNQKSELKVELHAWAFL
jgi:hypothetical protein